MRVVSEADAIENLPALLRDPVGDAIVINDGENDLGAIISMNDYEIIRKARVEQFMKSLDAFGEEIRARAAADGLSPDDLLKTLYPDATF